MPGDLDKNQCSKFICYQFGVSVPLLGAQVPHTTLHVQAETSALTWHVMLWVPPRQGKQPLSPCADLQGVIPALSLWGSLSP